MTQDEIDQARHAYFAKAAKTARARAAAMWEQIAREGGVAAYIRGGEAAREARQQELSARRQLEER